MDGIAKIGAAARSLAREVGHIEDRQIHGNDDESDDGADDQTEAIASNAVEVAPESSESGEGTDVASTDGAANAVDAAEKE